jgi:endonuclease/exonuclease/phosphatase (EEP) superfamily protein YafD
MNSASPSFVSRHVRWEGLLEAGLWIGLAGSWLGLLGHWHWLLDLCSHFRWQGIVVCFAAMIWAGWRRRRWVLQAALLTLGLNSWLLVRAGGPVPGGNARADFNVRVVSFNVLTTNQNHADVLRWLQQSDADLIFLMEVDHLWAKALQPLLTTHPHHLIQPASDNFGLALYSRLPPARLKILEPGELGLTADTNLALTDSVEACFVTAGRSWMFVGTHPVPPMGKEYAESRDRQLQALSRYLESAGLPALVTGDLNATPWSHGFRRLTSGTRLQAAPGSWIPTWRAGSLFGIPIDLSLTSPPLHVESRHIGPDLGSDHRPQTILLHWLE